MGIASSLALPAALVLSVATLGVAAWRVGASEGERSCRAEQAQAAIANVAQLAQRSQALRGAERELRGRLDLQTLAHQQELDRLERSNHDLAARLRTGAVRVSIPVVADVVGRACAAPATADPGAGAEPADARAELARETALALDDIAADGDAAILDLNRCLAAYETVRLAVSQAP
jgi:prophage endopeptidase